MFFLEHKGILTSWYYSCLYDVDQNPDIPIRQHLGRGCDELIEAKAHQQAKFMRVLDCLSTGRKTSSKTGTQLPRVEGNFLIGGTNLAIVFMDAGCKSTFTAYSSLRCLYENVNGIQHPSLTFPSRFLVIEDGTVLFMSLSHSFRTSSFSEATCHSTSRVALRLWNLHYK